MKQATQQWKYLMGITDNSSVFLYGASGHGRVIREIIEANGQNIVSFIDDNCSIDEFCGKKVFHEINGEWPVIVSIGANHIRKKIVQKLNCKYAIAIHPSAIISPSAIIGEGTVIMAGAVINAGVTIGRHCIINTGASVDHECAVGDFCHVAPHATLCGQVHLGEGVLMGVGSCAIPCVSIGDWCTVGAGAAVVRDLPANCTAVGVPAKTIKFHE